MRHLAKAAPEILDLTPPPYDLVSDIHGCFDELLELLDRLGYLIKGSGAVHHPDDRTLIFLGDLADRGPANLDVWRLALASLEAGTARYVPGNHDLMLLRYLLGYNVPLAHGFQLTAGEYAKLGNAERSLLGNAIKKVILDAPPYLILDEGRLVAAHAGIEEWMIGEVSTSIRDFVYFGDSLGQTTKLGLPVRRDWALDYRGEALIVYGHTPVQIAEMRNNTINLDLGCAYGGSLAALRFPELEIVEVAARQVYARPSMSDRIGDTLLTSADD